MNSLIYIKYLFLLLTNWLQLNFFIFEFPSYMDYFATGHNVEFIVFIFLFINCLLFFLYYINTFIRKMNVCKSLLDKYFIFLNVVINFLVITRYISNPWIFNEGDIYSIVIEIGEFVLFFIFSLIILITQAIILLKKFNYSSTCELWKTHKTKDKIFIYIFCGLFFLSTVFNTQIVPYGEKNYYELLKYIVIVGILLYSYRNSLIFLQARKFFYVLLSSFAIYMTIYFLLNVFIFDMLLIDRLDEIVYENFFYVKQFCNFLTLFVIYIWLINCYLQEKKYIRNK